MIFADSILSVFEGLGLWGVLGIMIVAGAATDIAKRVMRHKERIAMIQAGMNPDAPKAPTEEKK
ncbi:MAG: hypothetical protein ACREHD_12315 [Pirellulales bacterium]